MNNLHYSVMTASLTPLDQNLNIAYEHFAHHVQWLLDRKASGVILFGTTGEGNSFSISERKKGLEAVLRAGVEADRLMVGTGCCALTDTVDLTKHTLDAGVHRILVLPPFYYKKATNDGLFASFDHLLQCVGTTKIEVYVYHFPQMSGIAITPNLMERLLIAYPNHICGFKDSSGDRESILEMIRHFPQLQIYAGSEQFLLDSLRAGGAGCISATANVTSMLASELVSQSRSPRSDHLQHHVYQIRRVIEQRPMIAALKALMQHITGDDLWANIRPPLRPLSSRDAQECIQSYELVISTRNPQPLE
ncbi:MAG: dihydrodipicolinate synthase family protein [Bacteroidetes bacterium]|nr:dihydrodipicolinate synthase family protein [Bacteroidota bacterium]